MSYKYSTVQNYFLKKYRADCFVNVLVDVCVCVCGLFLFYFFLQKSSFGLSFRVLPSLKLSCIKEHFSYVVDSYVCHDFTLTNLNHCLFIKGVRENENFMITCDVKTWNVNVVWWPLLENEDLEKSAFLRAEFFSLASLPPLSTTGETNMLIPLQVSNPLVCAHPLHRKNPKNSFHALDTDSLPGHAFFWWHHRESCHGMCTFSIKTVRPTIARDALK